MQLFNILNCSGNITSCCTDPGLTSFLVVVKRLYSIIQIVIPILLIFALVLNIFKLINTPDDKRGIKLITNPIIAALVVFFLPTIVSAVLGLLSVHIQFTACLLSAEQANRISRATNYVPYIEETRKSIYPDAGGYEYGTGDEPGGSSGSGGSSGPSNLSGGMPIPMYYQQDYDDVILAYPDRTVAGSGCGFTSCAMIISYLLDQRITPREFVGDWSRAHYCSSGMIWTLPQAAVEHYGLASVRQTTSIDEAVQALRDNHPVMSSQGPGIFTSGGHLIVLRGLDSSGRVLVNDPNKYNSIDRGYNNRAFTPAEINRSNRMYFIFPKK